MIVRVLIILFLFETLITSLSAQEGDIGTQPSILLGGYVKDMPALMADRRLTSFSFMNIFHNRLNIRWNVSRTLHVGIEGRNLLYRNDLLNNNVLYRECLEMDPGYLDLSTVWFHSGSWLAHGNMDRLYLDWQEKRWQVRLGRQRINWGVNLVSNPNDLFNTYSFFDFDYEERPGSDAIRVQHYLGDLSKVQLAFRPARESRGSVAAMMFNFNHMAYDMQILTAYYRHRLALGFGWAGHVKEAGFKGEATWFYDLDPSPGIKRANLVAAVGFDYVFGSGTFLVLEGLYNGGYQRQVTDNPLITQPMQADNIMFSKFATTLSVQHPFSTLWGVGLAVMALPDIEAAFLMPSLNYSLMTNLDLGFVMQGFTGGKGTAFEQAGSGWYASIKYSF